MKLIPLSKGLFAKIDDEDFELVSQFKWHVNNSNGSKKPYAVRNKTKESAVTLMHGLIMGAKGIDHINGDTLDNRKTNLRICSHKENIRNYSKPKHNSSGYKGVSWHKEKKKWRGYIKFNSKYVHLGYFDTKEKAAESYNEKAKELFGEFAKLNEI